MQGCDETMIFLVGVSVLHSCKASEVQVIIIS